MKYLQNNICDFEPLQPIDYSVKKNMIVTSLFRMKHGGYKNFKTYLNGIRLLSTIAKKNDLHVRIFIDATIKNDKEIMAYLTSFDNISLILYKCEFFWIDDHHVGLFGTLIRFFPLFDFPNNDAKTVFLADADTKEQYISQLIDLYNILKKNNILEQNYLAYIGRYFHVNINSQKIINVANKGEPEIYLPYCIAQKFLGTKRISIKPFVRFIENIKEYMNTENLPQKILSDYYIHPDKFKIKCENNICFGIDEYFINRVLFKYLLRKNKAFCYTHSFNLAQFYYFKHPKNIEIDLIGMPKDDYVNIFNDYMKKSGLDKYTYDEIDKQIYINDEKVDLPVSSIATPFMKTYADKILPLLENICDNKDYRIYAKSQLYGFNQVDHKKYFQIKYLHLINQKEHDIVISSTEYKN